MREIAKIGFKLLIITLIGGICLGITYSVTQKPIEEHAKEKANEARRGVLIAETYEEIKLEDLKNSPNWSDKFSKNLKNVYVAYGKEGYIGATFEVTSTGYGGEMVIMVGINADGTIAGVNVVSNGETQGIGSKAMQKSFLELYIGKDSAKAINVSENAINNDVEVISGATISSKAVNAGVDVAALAMNQLVKGEYDK